jgi:hypothetical protein
MRRLGLFDEDGSLTNRGNKWRVDGTYSEACQEMLADIYPEELASLTGDSGEPNYGQIKTWFGHQGFGESNASQMAATYVLIAAKKIPEITSTGAKKTTTPTKGPTPKPAKTPQAAPPKVQPKGKSDATDESGDARHSNGPNVHLDIQIHIPADATPEQIETIFASMAKHLYGRAGN